MEAKTIFPDKSDIRRSKLFWFFLTAYLILIVLQGVKGRSENCHGQDQNKEHQSGNGQSYYREGLKLTALGSSFLRSHEYRGVPLGRGR